MDSALNDLLRGVDRAADAANVQKKIFIVHIKGEYCACLVKLAGLAGGVELLIADEPTTALDVTIQAQILDLLRTLQKDLNMALVLITHNMGVVSEMAQRVAVMYAGQVVEERAARDLFESPQHPYTAALMAAMPERSGGRQRLATIAGVVPGAWDRPSGCLFEPRCEYATPSCRAERPLLRPWAAGAVRCHYAMGEPDREARIARDRAGAVVPA